MKKKQPKYEDPVLEEFHKRLHHVTTGNLKKLSKSYQDEIARLLEYSLVVTEALEHRKK
jgi:hypothetical protein